MNKVLLADQLDTLHMDLTSLQELSQNGDLDAILEDSGKSIKEKAQAVEAMLSTIRSPELATALRNCLTQGELSMFTKKFFLSFILKLQKDLEQIAVIRLQVAVEFKPADLHRMADLLARRLGRPVAFDLTVDKTLLGGTIIQIGSHIYDYSLRSRLNQFHDEWDQTLNKKGEVVTAANTEKHVAAVAS
jgi:F-type H+-transporting ATPase subunit delta